MVRRGRGRALQALAVQNLNVPFPAGREGNEGDDKENRPPPPFPPQQQPPPSARVAEYHHHNDGDHPGCQQSGDKEKKTRAPASATCYNNSITARSAGAGSIATIVDNDR